MPGTQNTERLARTAATKLAKKLGVRSTPDVKGRKSTPRTTGKRTGMGICAFWCALFEANEALPKARKMTDEEIKRQMIQEFPSQPAIQKLGPVGQRGTVTVNQYRIMYNTGKLSNGVLPAKPSRRYTDKGELANPRTGKPLKEKS